MPARWQRSRSTPAPRVAELGENKAFILKLAQIHPLRVRVRVRVTLPAALYGRIKPGSWAEVKPEKPADGRHAATVTGIDKLVDAASSTFQVRPALTSASRTLPAGLKCWVSLPGV